jgi:two-component system catabolic regulation response regulator CreB
MLLPMPARILVVEDEPSICENVVYALEADGFTVASATTGSAALEMLQGQRQGQAQDQGQVFDLMILDVGLPDMTGFEVCKAVRKEQGLPILFLTARSSEVDRVVGLELGGDDYVVKPFSPRELVARVRAILRRTVAPPAVGGTGAVVAASATGANAKVSSQAVPLVIDEARCVARYFGVALTLSRYEFRMLKAFASHPGRVLSREQLMEHASAEPDASMERTVDTHIKTLRARLRAVRPGIDAIVTHRGLGYALLEDWPETAP